MTIRNLVYIRDMSTFHANFRLCNAEMHTTMYRKFQAPSLFWVYQRIFDDVSCLWTVISFEWFNTFSLVVHMLAQAIPAYLMMVFLPSSVAQYGILVFSMAYLSSVHIHRCMYNPQLDISAYVATFDRLFPGLWWCKLKSCLLWLLTSMME